MSQTPLVVITGTGTGIGKTHFAAALATAWGRTHRVAALKPIETGAPRGSLGEDAKRLGQTSTFHVTRFRPPYIFTHPVSPHLAARRARRPIDPARVVSWVDDVRAMTDATIVELAGGLFSPLGPNATNATLARALRPTAILLVAPDRLGVLHDVAAATRAARTERLTLAGIVLVAPPEADSSTGTNAAELAVVTDVPVLATVPRGSVAELARGPAVARVLRKVANVAPPTRRAPAPTP